MILTYHDPCFEAGPSPESHSEQPPTAQAPATAAASGNPGNAQNSAPAATAANGAAGPRIRPTRNYSRASVGRVGAASTAAAADAAVAATAALAPPLGAPLSTTETLRAGSAPGVTCQLPAAQSLPPNPYANDTLAVRTLFE